MVWWVHGCSEVGGCTCGAGVDEVVQGSSVWLAGEEQTVEHGGKGQGHHATHNTHNTITACATAVADAAALAQP